MGSGFATIPQIDASVPVQTTPPRQARTAPFVPVPGAEQLKQGARGLNDLSKVLAVQYEHKQILDANTVSTGVDKKFAELRAQASTLPGDQQASTFEQQSNEIIKAALDDPANGHIKGYLQAELPKRQNAIYGNVLMAGVHKTAQEQHQQATSAAKMTADVAGANYTINPDGSFIDNPTAQAAEQKYQGLVQAMWPNNPAARDELMATYDQQKAEKRLQAVAGKDPTKIGEFIGSLPPGIIDGNQIQGAYSHANEAMALPQRQLDAAHANLRAGEIDYQQKYITQNGHPDMARANDASKFNKWEAGDYRSIMGRDYEMETPPEVKALYDKQIGDLKSVDEAEQLKNNLHAAGAFKEMNGGDVQQYLGKVDEQIKQIKTPAGQAKILAEQALKDYYAPTTFSERSFHRQDLERPYGEAVAHFRAAILAHPDDANAIWDDVKKLKAAYPRPTFGGAAAAPTPTPGVSSTGAKPAHTPAPVDDATAAAYKAWLMTHPEVAR